MATSTSIQSAAAAQRRSAPISDTIVIGGVTYAFLKDCIKSRFGWRCWTEKLKEDHPDWNYKSPAMWYGGSPGSGCWSYSQRTGKGNPSEWLAYIRPVMKGGSTNVQDEALKGYDTSVDSASFANVGNSTEGPLVAGHDVGMLSDTVKLIDGAAATNIRNNLTPFKWSGKKELVLAYLNPDGSTVMARATLGDTGEVKKGSRYAVDHYVRTHRDAEVMFAGFNSIVAGAKIYAAPYIQSVHGALGYWGAAFGISDRDDDLDCFCNCDCGAAKCPCDAYEPYGLNGSSTRPVDILAVKSPVTGKPLYQDTYAVENA